MVSRSGGGWGPASRGVTSPGMFPPMLLFPLMQWRGKGRCSLGEWGPPCTPHSRQQHWFPFLGGGSSCFGIWVQLCFLEHSVLLGLCQRCSSSACGFGVAAISSRDTVSARRDGSQSRQQWPSCGEAEAAPAVDPSPGAGRGRAEASHRLPHARGGGSMSSRLILDGNTLR